MALTVRKKCTCMMCEKCVTCQDELRFKMCDQCSLCASCENCIFCGPDGHKRC